MKLFAVTLGTTLCGFTLGVAVLAVGLDLGITDPTASW